MSTKTIYIVTRRVYISLYGRAVLDPKATDISGAFTDKKSALDFTRKVTDSLIVPNGRTFRFVEGKKKERTAFSFHQKETVWPFIMFVCERQPLLTMPPEEQPRKGANDKPSAESDGNRQRAN